MVKVYCTATGDKPQQDPLKVTTKPAGPTARFLPAHTRLAQAIDRAQKDREHIEDIEAAGGNPEDHVAKPIWQDPMHYGSWMKYIGVE